MEEHTRSRGSEVPRSELTAGTRKGKAEGGKPPGPFHLRKTPGVFLRCTNTPGNGAGPPSSTCTS
jgi:hypothetical protein